MGLIVNPYVFAVSGPTFFLSDSTDNGGQFQHTGNFWEGYIAQAASSGTINYMWVKGALGDWTGMNYRLVIYQATNATTISGAKLGETIADNSLLTGELKQLPLLASVSITSGSYYALGIQKDGTMYTATRAASGGLRFADTYSDGALGTAPAGVNNGAAHAIWATN